MEMICNVSYKHRGKKHTIYFGHPDTEQEFQEMFDLRYRVYVKRGYIDAEKFSNDQDEYDKEGRSVHFIAKKGDRIMGAVRFITTHPLPTEEIYEFKDPSEIPKLPKDKKAELGRLVVMPLEERQGDHVPRHFLMMFLIYSVLSYAACRGLEGGYAFVKEKLTKKLTTIKAPVHIISNYREEYPETGILYPYFNQKENPVYPIFFLTREFKKVFDRILSKKILFQRTNGNSFVLKDNILVKLFRIFGFV